MKLYRDKLKAHKGYLEGKPDAVDSETIDRALGYKKNVIKQFVSLSPDLIETGMAGNEFYVTRKYDGEMSVIFYNEGEIVIINRSGRVRTGLVCTDEAKKLLEQAKIKQAIIPAEMYVDDTSERTRVYDLIKSVADADRAQKLLLAPYDILELDNKAIKAKNYGDIHKKLESIFGKSEICKPVKAQKAKTAKEVKKIYDEWVTDGTAEGLIVRTESSIVYKIKPRFTVDAAVIGFSEGMGHLKGQVRSLLLALMSEEGKYQVIGRVGTGISDEERKDLIKKLEPAVISSKFIETDSNHVAFRMVKPELVVEISIGEVIYEFFSGPVKNSVIEIKDGEYNRHGEKDGFAIISPVFVRLRDDKTVNPLDVRADQINSITAISEEDNDSTPETEIKKSEILIRKVFKKELSDKLMVQKYVIWKTNKEEYNEDYPAYVLHYTNFSTGRQDALQREIRISDSRDQLEQIMDTMITTNVKKGWSEV